MSLPILDAAQFILENSRRTVTQLELQKLLYLSQMTHLGKYNKPVLAARFEAWKFGPVNRLLYNEIKRFGANPIPSTEILGNVDTISAVGHTAQAVLNQTVDELSEMTASDLIRITHWVKGAWAKTYNSKNPNSEIPESLMRQEYFDRLKLAKAKAQSKEQR